MRIFLAVIVFSLSSGFAQDAELPVAVDAAKFADLKKQPPFERTLNFSETWALRGVGQIDEEPIASVFNRHTKKTVTVTRSQANELGWKMVEVVDADELNGVSVKIDFGGEIAEVKYDESQLQPAPTNRGGGDGERRKKGPTKEEVDRWKKLPDEKKKQFGEYIKAVKAKYPNASREEMGAMMRGALSRLSDGYDIKIPEAPEQK